MTCKTMVELLTETKTQHTWNNISGNINTTQIDGRILKVN